MIQLTEEILEYLYRDDSDLEDDCGCKQQVGQEPFICPKHLEKLRKIAPNGGKLS